MRVIGLAALAILSGTTSAKNVERKRTNSLHKSGVDSSLAALRAGFEQLDIKRHLQDEEESMSMAPADMCSFCPSGVDDPAAVLPVPGGETCEQASTFAAGLAASDPQCTVVLLAENTCCPPKNIVEIAAGNEDFSTLVAAVTAAGLVDTLSGDGPFTVFGKFCLS